LCGVQAGCLVAAAVPAKGTWERRPQIQSFAVTLTAGNPIATVSQVDYSPFFTDDWKARKDLTLLFFCPVFYYKTMTNLHMAI